MNLQLMMLDLISKAMVTGTSVLPSGMTEAFNKIVQLLQGFAGLWLVVVILGCGFTAWYFEDGVRRVKEKAIAIGIGSACIFGSAAIATAVQTVFTF